MKWRFLSLAVFAVPYAVFMGCTAEPLMVLLSAVPQFGWALANVGGPTPTIVVGVLVVLAGCGYAALIRGSGAISWHAAVIASCIVTAFLLMAILALVLHVCGAWLDWLYAVARPSGTGINLFGREPRDALFWCLILGTSAILMCLAYAPYCRRATSRWIRYAVAAQLLWAIACVAAALLIGGRPTAGEYWQYSGAACALAIGGTLVGVLFGSALFLYGYRAVSRNGKQSPL